MHRLPLLTISLLVLALILIGCGQAEPPAQSVDALVATPAAAPETAVPQPTLQPPTEPTPGTDPKANTVVLPANCYREGLPSYVDRKSGFCFAYPQNFTLGEMNPGQPAIYGPALDKSADPLRASLTVEVRPAAGKGLPDLLTMYAVETGTSVETRLGEITLDGEQGKVQDPVRGRPNARAILVLHKGSLFILSFAPSLKDTPASEQSAVWKQGQKDMEALYEITTGSFAFLDQPRSVTANDTLGVTPSCVVDGNSLYLDAGAGYCLAIPPRFVVGEMNPGQRAIFSPALDASSDPLRVSLLVEAKPVPAGSEINTLAGEFVKGFPGATITSSPTEIGRHPAVMLRPVPARMSSLNVLVLNNNKLFTLWFQPDGNGRAKPELDSLTAAVMRSFGFLPTSTPPNFGANIKTVNFENIGLRYDSSLAKEVTGQAVPKLTEPFVPFDTYRFVFDGYIVKSPAQPTVWIFSGDLAPEYDQTAINTLKRYLKDGTTPAKTLPLYLTGPSANELDLPVFVPINARPVLSTQWSMVNGAGANGLRFVTLYSQGLGPLDPNALVYAYSGLNPDGRVAFAASFAVHPAAPLNLPAAETNALLNDPTKLEAYNKQVAELVAKLGPSDFVPDLRLLDQAMASLSVDGTLPPIKGKSETQVVMENCVKDGMQNEANSIEGYCFLYPTGFERKDRGNGQTAFVGPALDKSADPLRETLTIDVRPAGGQTLAQLVDAYLKENSAPGLKTQSTDIMVGGEHAIMLAPLAGRPTYRAVLVLHGDMLYVLLFSPDSIGFPEGEPDTSGLFGAVVSSFTFLPR